jgi:hypothetical protein
LQGIASSDGKLSETEQAAINSMISSFGAE